MSITYALNPTTLDMIVGPDGNLVTVSGAQQIAQDVASAIMTFAGECWYDTTQGLPYFQSIFGQRPAGSFLKAQIKAAAFTVPTVTACSVTALNLVNRQLKGTVLVSTTQSLTPIEVNF